MASARCGPSAWRQNRVRGGRSRLHPQEALLQQARALQHSEAFAEYRQRRVVVEHRLARLVQLGIRQFPLLRTCQNPVPVVPGRHRSQPDPRGRQSRVDGRNRLRPSQRRQSPRRWHRQPRRLARANYDPHFARGGLTDQILLLNKGFPSEFLGVVLFRKLSAITPAFLLGGILLILLGAPTGGGEPIR